MLCICSGIIYTYIMELYPYIKRKEASPFTTTSTDLEGITLSDTETEQDPMILTHHVLSLPFVCRKTLAKA